MHKTHQNFGNNHRRQRAYSMSTGIPMLDMVNELTFASPNVLPITKSAPIPITGAQGRRRHMRFSISETSSSSSSVKSSSARGSPVTNALFYAAAKFNESPSPASLPHPPLHWLTATGAHEGMTGKGNACA